MRWWLALVAVAALAATPEELYQSTKYREALRLLEGKQDAAALQLAGQCWYMEEDYKKAIDLLERAVAGNAASSMAHLWLGRAYGRRAETAMPLIAPKFASKARQEFEKAVELDPKNVAALSDLFSYYREAPGFLGGGKDKAARIAERIAALDKAEGFYTQAVMAEDRKEDAAAEKAFRMAVTAAPQQIGRVLDVAKFLARRGRWEESEIEFRKAEKMDPNSPKLLFDRAQTYIEAKRHLDQARTLLQRYLKLPLTPDDAPRRQAEKLLRTAGA